MLLSYTPSQTPFFIEGGNPSWSLQHVSHAVSQHKLRSKPSSLRSKSLQLQLKTDMLPRQIMQAKTQYKQKSDKVMSLKK